MYESYLYAGMIIRGRISFFIFWGAIVRILLSLLSARLVPATADAVAPLLAEFSDFII